MRPQNIDVLTDAAILSLRRTLDAVPFDDPLARGLPLAILVDPAIHDLLAENEHTRAVPRLAMNIRIIDPAQRPYLLILGGATMNERALNTTLRLAVEECAGLHDRDGARPRSVCAWLVAQDAQSPNWHAVVSAMNRRAWARPPEPEPWAATVLRYWDPRLSLHLSAALGGGAWGDCLQALGIAQWWAMRPDATLAHAGEPQPTRTQAPADWQLDARQWKTLRVLGWGNVLAQAASGWSLGQTPQPQALRDTARRALGHGLRSKADVLRFAHTSLTVHPQFDRHPQVRQTLQDWQRCGSPAGGFAGVVEGWDDDFIDQLHSGQWLQDGPAATPLQPNP